MDLDALEGSDRCAGGDADPWRMLAQPCPSCPWRLDQTAQDIPGFSREKAQDLVTTCPDVRGHGPSFDAKVFACHQSKPGGEFPCAGWLATVGHCHPIVRWACIQGKVPEVVLAPGPGWPALHQNYGEVLRKLEGAAE
ncbi:DUF6283 family protein [Acidovorax sp.]|uniref:DUF6283 family protein n=1 Tax=Acidovorax sp. TaxID=1872122 RepID=UPI0027B9F09D|nr:DUF6283 family protein [Acidovorax sp.]